jgi:phage tail sheath gpL-like
LAIETAYKNLVAGTPSGRPVHINIFGLAQESISVVSKRYDYVGLAEAAAIVGYKSTIYQDLLALNPNNGLGVGVPISFYPLTVTTGVKSAGEIAPTLGASNTDTETYYIQISNNNGRPAYLPVVKNAGMVLADLCTAIAASINSKLDCPFVAVATATEVGLTCGHEGAAGNEYVISVTVPTDPDYTFAITQPVNGAGTVDVDSALSSIQDNWDSHVLNAFSKEDDSTNLDKFSVYGELRWSAEVHKPIKFYTGTNATLTAARAVTDGRKNDRTNSIKPNHESADTPWFIAASILREQCRTAQQDAPTDYTKLLVSGLTPVKPTGTEFEDATMKDGLCTYKINDGVYEIADSVMCYHPDGESPPGWQYDNDIEKECYMLWNFTIILEYGGYPLASDDQIVENPNARKPSWYRTRIYGFYEGASKKVVITDLEGAKKNSIIDLSTANNRRIDADLNYSLAGNTNIIAASNNFNRAVAGGAS